MKTTILRAAVLCAALLLSPAVTTLLAATQAELEQKVEELKARLALTPEQETAIKPLAEQRLSALEALSAKYAGNTSRSARRSMMKEAKGIQDAYVAKVEPLLNDQQKAEWKKIREEMREELKTRWQNR